MTNATTGTEVLRGSAALPARDALLCLLDDGLIDGSGDRVGLMIMELDDRADGGAERTELLEHVAARWRQIVCADALFCALDHEVFALAWRHADEVDQTTLVARVVASMRAPFALSTCELALDVVVGMSLSSPASTAETVLAKAERALTVMKTACRYGLAGEGPLGDGRDAREAQ